MAYWLIEWDCGYGPSADVVEAETQGEANDMAYDAWKEDAENNAEYSAEPATSEGLENHGIDPEGYGLKPTEYEDD